jgi:hypothetical protein
MRVAVSAFRDLTSLAAAPYLSPASLEGATFVFDLQNEDGKQFDQTGEAGRRRCVGDVAEEGVREDEGGGVGLGLGETVGRSSSRRGRRDTRRERAARMPKRMYRSVSIPALWARYQRMKTVGVWLMARTVQTERVEELVRARSRSGGGDVRKRSFPFRAVFLAVMSTVIWRATTNEGRVEGLPTAFAGGAIEWTKSGRSLSAAGMRDGKPGSPDLYFRSE